MLPAQTYLIMQYNTFTVIYDRRKYDHMTPLHCELHWLQVPECITFRLATLAYRCQYNMVSDNLAVQLNRASQRHLLTAIALDINVWTCVRTLYTWQSATVRSVWPQLGRGTPWHHPCSPLSHLQFFDVAWTLNCSHAPSQTDYISDYSIALWLSLQPWSRWL